MEQQIQFSDIWSMLENITIALTTSLLQWCKNLHVNVTEIFFPDYQELQDMLSSTYIMVIFDYGNSFCYWKWTPVNRNFCVSRNRRKAWAGQTAKLLLCTDTNPGRAPRIAQGWMRPCLSYLLMTCAYSGRSWYYIS